MSDERRPVWPTREIRDYLANLAIALHADNEACAGGQWGGIGHLDALVTAWDAAPAGSAEAVRVALTTPGEVYPDIVLGPILAAALTPEVLRALGCPRC